MYNYIFLQVFINLVNQTFTIETTTTELILEYNDSSTIGSERNAA